MATCWSTQMSGRTMVIGPRVDSISPRSSCTSLVVPSSEVKV